MIRAQRGCRERVRNARRPLTVDLLCPRNRPEPSAPQPLPNRSAIAKLGSRGGHPCHIATRLITCFRHRGDRAGSGRATSLNGHRPLAVPRPRSRRQPVGADGASQSWTCTRAAAAAPSGRQSSLLLFPSCRGLAAMHRLTGKASSSGDGAARRCSAAVPVGPGAGHRGLCILYYRRSNSAQVWLHSATSGGRR